MGRLRNKVAIVTGAGRLGNIGVAVCDAFLREGARAVIGSDYRTNEAAEIVAAMQERHGPGRFRLLPHDVTSEDDWKRVVGDALEGFGAIDVLVNNAGIQMHGGIASTSLEEMRRLMAVNTESAFLGMKYCAPALATTVERFPDGGSIINTLSMSSYMPSATTLSYQVSKAAGRMLALCAAIEFGPQRIRVNSVHPGLTITPLANEYFDDYVAQGHWETREAAIDAIAAFAPLGVKSQPEDAAHAFVYFASDESRFVTGASLYHDGGVGQRF